MKETGGAFVYVSVCAHQIGPESAGTRVAPLIEFSIRFDHGGVECNCHPFVGLDDDSRLVTALLPLLAMSIQVPRTRHAHVGVQHDAVVERDLQVLAMAVDAFNGCMNAW